MTKSEKTAGAPRRQLSLLDTTSIIVGIIIGAGIYKTSSLVAASVDGPGPLILVWIAGGFISLIGALCYAELATSFPREGGDYVYLTQAFGRRMGFLFVWSEFWIIRPGNVGMMAFVFAEYAESLLPLRLGEAASRYDEMAYAAAAVTVLTVLNILGVRSGKWTQNVLTGIKVIGLQAIFLVALLGGSDATQVVPAVSSIHVNYELAMILVLFTFGGWNDVSFVAAEIREPGRNLLRALLIGLGLVTFIYVLVNLAFIRVLGFEGTAVSDVPAAAAMQATLGDVGSRLMSALVCVSALGAMNGMMFAGARLYFALGSEHQLYAWLGRWSARFDAPLRALLLQFVVTVGLVLLIGRHANGFDKLLTFSAPVFWAFILLVGVSLFVLRGKRPDDAANVYRVPVYPLTPLAFCASTAFLCYSSVRYALSNGGWEFLWAAGILFLGVVMSFFDPARRRK